MRKELKIMNSKFSNVYILCPRKYTSGGPEALHQLAYYLDSIGINVFICYFNALSQVDREPPAKYGQYKVKVVAFFEIKDQASSLIIIPENLYRLNSIFKKSHKYIWWLSVNNFKKRSIVSDFKFLLKSIKLNNFKIGFIIFKSNFLISNKIEKNLCASYYAMDYVNNLNQLNNCLFLIEPIGLEFLNKYMEWDKKNEKRKDVVLYNPKKGKKFTKKLIALCPNINFVELKNFTFSELVDVFKTSKIYIDFGEFPGAERLPKEAVLFGDLIVTGKNGASKYFDDVKIDNRFKFDTIESNLYDISIFLNELIRNYDNYCVFFNDYKNTVLELESNFIKQLKNIFEVDL